MHSLPPKLTKRLSKIYKWFKKRPHFAALVIFAAYLLVFQRHFVFYGDIWAEGYAEYLTGILYKGWLNFFTLEWTGYFNLLPKLLAQSYVSFGLPLEFIDYFYRAVALVFVGAVTTFVAHPINRAVIKSDAVRILFCVMSFEVWNHLSSFNFINVWYFGFLPIIFISLNPRRFQNEKKAVVYSVTAAAIILSKPSIMLLPVVMYRMVRLKEYMVGVWLMICIALQTLLILSSPHLQGIHAQPVSMGQKLISLLFGPTLLLLKALSISPGRFGIIVVLTLPLFAMAYLLWKYKGFWYSLAVMAVFGIAAYTFFFAPDAKFVSVRSGYKLLFDDMTKIQREAPVVIIMLLVIAIVTDYVILAKRKNFRLRFGLFSCLAILTILLYKPIDLQSAAVAMDTSSFKQSIRDKQSICMPIGPTPSWGLNAGPPVLWYFQYRGGCIVQGNGRNIDFTSFTTKINTGRTFTITPDPNTQIKSFVLPVYNPNPQQERQLILKSKSTGRIYHATVHANDIQEHLSYVSYNMVGEPPADGYELTISEPEQKRSDLRIGKFTDGGYAVYSLYMGYPNLSEAEK